MNTKQLKELIKETIKEIINKENEKPNGSKFENQVKTTEVAVRNPGHSSQYYTLKTMINGEVFRVFTSKNLNYILNLERDFLKY